MSSKLSLIFLSLILSNTVYAAIPIDLRHQSTSYMQRLLAAPTTHFASNTNPIEIKQLRTDVDFNHIAHTRIQQLYKGTLVWDATAVIHTPNAKDTHTLSANLNPQTTMNGMIYEGIEKDLIQPPTKTYYSNNEAKALQQAKAHYGNPSHVISKKESVNKIIFVDDKNIAHYAYLVTFYVDDNKTGAHKPTYIMDMETLRVYRNWDQVYQKKSKIPSSSDDNDDDDMANLVDLSVGGIGGNVKMGQIVYDGGPGNQATLKMKAEPIGMGETDFYCILTTEGISVMDVSYLNYSFGRCIKDPARHNGVAWLSLDEGETRWKKDEMNGGFSPALDAYNAATVIKNFYHDWYNIAPLVKEDGKTPVKLIMRVHYGRQFDNAYWDGEVMTFGDGGELFYPLASLGVAAHEIGHGFTDCHSHIDGYQPEMAALHESFSDMAAVATDYYLHKTNKWEIGREIMKSDRAMRYLDEPTKDGRSISHLKDFDNAEPHAGAGITNKAFYLIATSEGWDTHKAFNIMLKANMNYWTSSMKTLTEAACGVIAATKDYHYPVNDVKNAFAKVGINTDKC